MRDDCVCCGVDLQKDINKHNKEQEKIGHNFDWAWLIKGRGMCDLCFLIDCEV